MAENVSFPRIIVPLALLVLRWACLECLGSDGESIPVTVINIGLNVVSSLKSFDKHGYSAVQIGYRRVKKLDLISPYWGIVPN